MHAPIGLHEVVANLNRLDEVAVLIETDAARHAVERCPANAPQRVGLCATRRRGSVSP
jgi:hypothetical protein